jgi:D-cysteine desulfhydrase
MAGTGSAPVQLVVASVSRPPWELFERINDIAAKCARRLGLPRPDRRGLAVLDARGPGFGIAGPEEAGAADLALRRAGLVLDPVYTAKAALLLGHLGPEEMAGTTVFWHTGGVMAAAAALQEGARHAR